MQDRPSASELLSAVRRFLTEEVAPAVDDRLRFHARVAANVLEIVARELDLEERNEMAEWHGLDALLGSEALPGDRAERRWRLTRRNEELCARIQAGDADAGAWGTSVFRHVRATTLDKLRVANPKYLGK